MTIKEKVLEKEASVKILLDELRAHLNTKRLEFNKAPQTWEYISTLGIAETKLKDLLEYLKQPV